MRRSATTLALGAVLALWALPAPASANSPWWQLLSGSRPTNLQPAPDQAEVQEVKAEKQVLSATNQILAAKVEVGGGVIGCLGAGSLLNGGITADVLCELKTGLPATETAAGFQEMLEAVPSYAEAEGVEVGGPANVGEGPFTVTTPERWVPYPVKVTPLLYQIPGTSSETVMGSASTQILSKGSGRLVITLTNLGDASLTATSEDPLQIVDALPGGAAAYGAQAEAGWNSAVNAGGVHAPNLLPCTLPSTARVECSFEGTIRPYEAIELEVLVALEGTAADGEAGEVTVTGGDAAAKVVPQVLNVDAAPTPFGLEHFSIEAEQEGGAAALPPPAGSHPFQLTTTIVANSGPQGGTGRSLRDHPSVAQPALPRNLRFTLPAGLVADATAVQTCEMAVFLTSSEADSRRGTNECPDQSAVGVTSVTLYEGGVFGLARLAVPVFNLPPAYGEPARLGFMIAGTPTVIDTAIDPTDSYRAIAEVRNIPQTIQFLASTTTIWGNPGSPAHDLSRGWKCSYTASYQLPGVCDEPEAAERREAPFLRMPVSCASPLGFDAAIEPWNVALGSLVDRSSSASPPLTGCNREPFDPRISSALTSKLAANPSGLDLGIQMPNSGLKSPEEGAVSEAQFKRAEVTLPEGVTINPSQAEGLAVCSEADYARERYDSGPGEGCPEASKIGSVQISTPLLTEQASGAVYVATPYENPSGSLIALYLIARIPERGILVKQPIEVKPDPVTGQIVSVAENVPQLPFSSFKFHFREGGRSPLITPPGCGTFNTVAKFTPWSAKDPDNPAPGEVVERRATFTVDRGVTGGGCPSGPAPFHPGFEAGTENNQAGSYSPFLMHLTRQDGEQDLTKFSSILPPGVVGKIAGVPWCSEAGIAQAKGRTGAHGGADELERPSCPAASQIGATTAGAGVGSQLTYVKGSLYLAGPYHGDPLSVVSITPAVAGPFDAGTVVVRIALALNPITGEVEADGSASDPIPHILQGIPLNVRDLRVSVERPEFTLNATSCEEEQTRATLFGGGTVLAPLADHPVGLQARYQAAGCRALGFKPRLGLRLKGGTRRGAFPALHAVYTPRRHGDANLRRLALTFPHSEFIEQGHFRTICTRVQFAAGQGFGERCPKGSVYGHAVVWTPLLDEPLKGPVYLRSSNHNLPDAVLALHGLVDIEVAVRIDSTHGRLRAIVGNSPDAPVSRAIVRMQGGQKGLFVNSTNICAAKHRARVNAKGQNGRRDLLRPLTRAPGCAKAKRKGHRGHRRRGGHR